MKFNLDPPEPCLLCGQPTANLDRLCDPCWELKTRIERDPDVARAILANMGDGA